MRCQDRFRSSFRGSYESPTFLRGDKGQEVPMPTEIPGAAWLLGLVFSWVPKATTMWGVPRIGDPENHGFKY